MPDHSSALFLTAFVAILPLFGMIGIGALASRLRLFEKTESGVLNRFAILIGLPALVFATLLTKRFVATDIVLPTLYWIVQAIGLACALIASRLLRYDRPTTGAALLETFGNTGFIGYPMTAALFPEQMAAAVFIDQFGMTLMLYPGAIILASIYGEGAARDASPLREVAVLGRSPLFVALVAAIVLRAALSTFPHLLEAAPARIALGALAAIGAATIPVIMISIGMRMSAREVRRNWPGIAALGAIKLIIMPAACILIGRAVYHLHGELLSVSVLEAAMPPAAAATVFASQYRMNGGLAVACFFVLTVASAVTLPLMISLVR